MKSASRFIGGVLVALVASCGGGDGRAPVKSSTKYFAYVANNDTDTAAGAGVSAYLIDSANGVLAEISGSPFPAGSMPNAVAADPAGRFLYVANSGIVSPGFANGTISAYSINPEDGVLTPIAGSPFAMPGLNPLSLAVHPSGRFVYVVGSSKVLTYSIDTATGAVTVGSAIAVGTGPSSSPSSIAVTPTGDFAYVTNLVSNDVSVFAVNMMTGALTDTGRAVATGSDPHSIVIEPLGRFAYVANTGSASIMAYSINATNGALTAIGATVAGGLQPVALAPDPSGKFVLCANFGSNDLSSYAIGLTGAPTGVGLATPAGTSPRAVTVDPTGNFVYVANMNSNNISQYSLNTTTGVLTPIGTARAGSRPFSITTLRR